MNAELPARFEVGGDVVRVGVARQQRHLEEDDAGIPHLGGAAQSRQYEPADERLHQEEEEGADEQGGCEKRQGQDSSL